MRTTSTRSLGRHLEPDRSRRTSPRYGRLRRVVASVVAAATVAGCASTAPEAVPAPSPPVRPEATAEVPADGDPAADLPGLAARATGDLSVYDAPAAAEATNHLDAVTAFGSTTVLLVTAVGDGDADGWLQVALPVRPNGTTGWIRADDVELREVDLRVTVDLDDRELTVLDGGEVVLITNVAIGDADHPTPTGTFFVTDKLDTEDPDGPYGPYALGLSARSDVLTEFAGGDGQVGIHGTNASASIGQAASHGCLRVPNEVVEQLARLLPLGTPVVIS